MNSRKIIGTQWYSTQDGLIGIVAARTGMHEPEKGEWMAYIGRANGHNVEMDEQHIANWGAKVAPNIAHAFFPHLNITKYKEYDQIDWDKVSRDLEARSGHSEGKQEAQEENPLAGVDQMMEAEIAKGRSIYEAQLRTLEHLQTLYDPTSERWQWFVPRIAGARAELERYNAEASQTQHIDGGTIRITDTGATYISPEKEEK